MRGLQHDVRWFLTSGRFDPAWVQAVASVALVILGLVTLIVLCVYAWRVHSLAKSSRLSAEAAKSSAEAGLAQIQLMIDKERARVFVVPSEEPMSMQSNRDYSGKQQFTILNVGATPAINVAVRYRGIATDSEKEPQTSGGSQDRASVQDVIAANSKEDTWLAFESAFRDGLVPRAEYYIHVWGEATYNDVISSDLRTTRFRYLMKLTPSRDGYHVFDGTWVKFGLPDDNRTT